MVRDTVRVGDHRRVVRRPPQRTWWNREPGNLVGLDRQVRFECLDCGAQVQAVEEGVRTALERYPCRWS